MTDTEVALLRAIAAMPEEDTPRLVFADYLEERSGAALIARAEFIRLQVRAARLRQGDPERVAAQTRIDELLGQWDAKWQDAPKGFRALPGYHRGFPHRAAADASTLGGAGDDPRVLFIEHLELNPDGSAARLRKAVKGPLFARLRGLVVRGEKPLGEAGAKALAEGEYPRLERLVLAKQRIGDAGLRALCDSRGFPRLCELDLSGNEITDGGGGALLRSALIARLRRLVVWNNSLGRTMEGRLSERVP